MKSDLPDSHGVIAYDLAHDKATELLEAIDIPKVSWMGLNRRKVISDLLEPLYRDLIQSRNRDFDQRSTIVRLADELRVSKRKPKPIRAIARKKPKKASGKWQVMKRVPPAR